MHGNEGFERSARAVRLTRTTDEDERLERDFLASERRQARRQDRRNAAALRRQAQADAYAEA
jgi:hypothetical protein